MSKKVIEARSSGLLTYFRRVYEFRSLIVVLARRELKAQYAQSVLGILWAAIKPMMALAIFSLFFGSFIDLSDQISVAYPLFAFSGMVSWFYFTFLMTQAGTSVTNAQDLITKIYFPKLVLLLAKVLVGLVEFGISLILLVILMLILGHVPGPELAFLPVFLLLNILVGLTVGIWLAALTTRYRDFSHLLPYLVNFLIWLTPVFYPTTIVPEKYAQGLFLNPMAGVIAGFRWSLLGDEIPDWRYAIGMIPVLILFIGGLFFFVKIEREMPDRV